MDEQDSKPKSQPGREDERLTVTRREFLKGMGSSALVTSIALPATSADAAAAATPALTEAAVQFTVNGRTQRLKMKSHWTLLDVLRRDMALTGTKKFCDRGSCGACTVVMDGKAVYACSRLAIEAVMKPFSYYRPTMSPRR